MNLVTNSGLEQTDLGGLLRDYRLPPEVLPLAPERTPFSQFSRESLATAGRMALRYSEKRGILSHAVRHILGERPASAGISAHTIEAHIDGLDLPQPVADELLTLGFEPDGFARFVPAHYDAHYTFKVKTALGDSSRRAILLREIEAACHAARARLEQSNVEAYIELEIYRGNQRRHWSWRPAVEGWQEAFPLRPGALRLAVTDDYRKRADIHVKLSRTGRDDERGGVLRELLECAGFYHVVTWAGNDVCTAQFAFAREAKRVFDRLEVFFDHSGGATEMTLEPSPGMWRTCVSRDGGHRLAAVPPLVMGLDLE